MTTTPEHELALAPQHIGQMIDHAQAARPYEACGLLGGREGRVTRVYALPNTEESSVRYLAEPQAQVNAMLEIEEQGDQLIGIYHSHIDAPPYPSPRDVAMAHYPEAVYVIVSLTEGEPPALGGYRISGGEIQEVALAIGRPERVRG
ncbi:MAG: M67 family metallopeptidase [Bacillota bacterium]